jgi:hypothetical protein
MLTALQANRALCWRVSRAYAHLTHTHRASMVADARPPCSAAADALTAVTYRRHRARAAIHALTIVSSGSDHTCSHAHSVMTAAFVRRPCQVAAGAPMAADRCRPMSPQARAVPPVLPLVQGNARHRNTPIMMLRTETLCGHCAHGSRRRQT